RGGALSRPGRRCLAVFGQAVRGAGNRRTAGRRGGARLGRWPDLVPSARRQRCPRHRRALRRARDAVPRVGGGPRAAASVPARGAGGGGVAPRPAGGGRPSAGPQPRTDGLMQTHSTEAQLRDPGLARANQILRSCVHCGFCTATCPTYQVLGDELDSPRGRIYLIKEMLENGKVPDAKTVGHIDRCLSCLSCMTTCPSGVQYMHLVDHAREYIEKTYRRPMGERALRWLLARILPYPGRFRLALMGAKLARPFRRLVP